MDLQSLFTISEQNIRQDEFDALITFDPDHDIFKGHFPGQPVVPGVCLIHIVKEIAGIIAKREVLLKDGNNIKFLNMIDPREHPEVLCSGSFSFTEDNMLLFKAGIYLDSRVFFKFKGRFELA
ncbi:MAG: hypothetical protein HQ565_10835 [Bacteroidetes bacterium]|nr:hypothetical protein [Bacteroidota bacterium]